MVWHKKFGPSQNILGPVKGQGISERPTIRKIARSQIPMGPWFLRSFPQPTMDLNQTKLLMAAHRSADALAKGAAVCVAFPED